MTKKPPADQAAIRLALLQGESDREIAQAHGLTQARVSFIRTHDWTVSPQENRERAALVKGKSLDELHALLSSACQDSDLADRLSLSLARITHLAERLGLVVPHGRQDRLADQIFCLLCYSPITRGKIAAYVKNPLLGVCSLARRLGYAPDESLLEALCQSWVPVMKQVGTKANEVVRSTPAKWNEVRALVAQGKTRAEMSEALGVSEQRVSQLLHAMGLKAISGRALRSVRTRLRHEVMAEMRKAGTSVADIAAQMGLSRMRVYQIVGKANRGAIQTRNEEMRLLRLSGASVDEIAAQMGLSRMSVFKIVAPVSQEIRKARHDAVVSLAAQGKSLKEIQEVVGWSSLDVARLYCKRHGIPINYVRPRGVRAPQVLQVPLNASSASPTPAYQAKYRYPVNPALLRLPSIPGLAQQAYEMWGLVDDGRLLRMRRDACPPAFLEWVSLQPHVQHAPLTVEFTWAVRQSAAGFMKWAWVRHQVVTPDLIADYRGKGMDDALAIHAVCQAHFYHFQSPTRVAYQVDLLKRCIEEVGGSWQEIVGTTGSHYIRLSLGHWVIQVRVADHATDPKQMRADVYLDPGTDTLQEAIKRVCYLLNTHAPAWVDTLESPVDLQTGCREALIPLQQPGNAVP